MPYAARQSFASPGLPPAPAAHGRIVDRFATPPRPATSSASSVAGSDAGAGGSRSGTKKPPSSSGNRLTDKEIVDLTCKMLFFLVKEGHGRMIREVLPLLKSLNVKNDKGHNLLTVCCQERKTDLLRFFLTQTDKWGGVADLASEINLSGTLSLAVQFEMGRDLVEKMLDLKADPNFRREITRDSLIESPLVYAVAVGNDTIAKILLVSEADPNFCMKTSPMRWAVRCANADMVNLLIRARGDVLSEKKTLLTESDTDAFTDFLRRTIVQEKVRKGILLTDEEEDLRWSYVGGGGYELYMCSSSLDRTGGIGGAVVLLYGSEGRGGSYVERAAERSRRGSEDEFYPYNTTIRLCIPRSEGMLSFSFTIPSPSTTRKKFLQHAVRSNQN